MLLTLFEKTIKKLMTQYPEINKIVPGHGQFGGVELLTHTIHLVENERVERP